jgi:hypothetical protein
MLRRFRPFRHHWSVLVVLGALILASAGCLGSDPNSEGGTYCEEHPENC